MARAMPANASPILPAETTAINVRHKGLFADAVPARQNAPAARAQKLAMLMGHGITANAQAPRIPKKASAHATRMFLRVLIHASWDSRLLAFPRERYKVVPMAAIRLAQK